MMRAVFNCKNETRVWIEIDDEDDYTARVLQEDGSEIGRLKFRVIDDDSGSFLKTLLGLPGPGGRRIQAPGDWTRVLEAGAGEVRFTDNRQQQ